MTKLLFKLPWFLAAPSVVVLAIVLASTLNMFVGDYFVRSFIDEPDPLAASGTTGGDQPGNQSAPGQVDFARGTLRDGDPGHNGKGTARLIRARDGALSLRLENFSVTNGPDLFVYLSADPNRFSGDTATNLGPLKATDGNLNYGVPPTTDMAKYQSVIIWCKQFKVTFAVATLERTVAEAPAPSTTSTAPAVAAGAGATVAPSAPAPTTSVSAPPASSATTSTQPAAAPTQPATPATAAPAPATAVPATAAAAPASATPAPAQAAVLAEGTFRDGAPGHNGKGTARIIRDAQGALFLRFENFSVTNGPDLFVYITTSGGYEGERIKLGKLKATDGNQNYAIPAGTDISKFKSAIVWCDAFATLFAVATFGGN